MACFLQGDQGLTGVTFPYGGETGPPFSHLRQRTKGGPLENFPTVEKGGLTHLTPCLG